MIFISYQEPIIFSKTIDKKDLLKFKFRNHEVMMPKRVLFVCTGNVDHSPTAENMYKGVKGLEVRSAGTSIHAQNSLSKELVEWADIIYVMEEQHKTAIINLDSSAEPKIIILGIPDIYFRDQPELKMLLKQKLDHHLRNEVTN